MIAVDRDAAVDPCTVEGAGVVGGGSIAAGGVAGAAAGAWPVTERGCRLLHTSAHVRDHRDEHDDDGQRSEHQALRQPAGSGRNRCRRDHLRCGAGVVPLGSCAAAIPEDEAGT